MFVPARVTTRAQTSVSGPYVPLFRHAVHVVVFVQLSVFELTRKPVSPEPMIPFDQRPPSLSGFSLRRLKVSRIGSGSTGETTSYDVVADAVLE